MTVVTVIATDGAKTRSEIVLSRLPPDGSNVQSRHGKQCCQEAPRGGYSEERPGKAVRMVETPA